MSSVTTQADMLALTAGDLQGVEVACIGRVR